MLTKEVLETKIKEHQAEIQLLQKELESVKLSFSNNKTKENLGKLMVLKDRTLFHNSAVAVLEDLLKEFQ